MRKLENYSLTELVSIFAKKWGLKVYKKGDADLFNEKAPCILQTDNGTKPRYLLLWKNSMGRKPHKDVATKDKLIHPSEHLEQFKLAQLERGQNGTKKVDGAGQTTN